VTADEFREELSGTVQAMPQLGNTISCISPCSTPEAAATTRYRVRVALDLTCECFCPDLERAVEFLELLDGLTTNLVREVGRPAVPGRLGG
jgi:hypothetical protein